TRDKSDKTSVCALLLHACRNIAVHYLAAPRGFCATMIMLFHRNGNLPAPINRTTRNPESFNSCDRVLRDQNLMCPPSQKGERCASHLLVRARTRFFRKP